MKRPFIFASFLIPAVLSAQVLLTDNFSSPSVDSSKWIVATPIGGSSVDQSGGFVTLTQRGTLISQNSFSGDIQISGSFTLNQNLEHLKIVVRTDGLIPTGNSFAERNGIIFAFSNDGDQISIQKTDSNDNHINLAIKSYSLQTSQTYSFSATLIGTSIGLTVNGIEELIAISDYSSGGKIALYSREGFGTSSTLDEISVTVIPEPASLSQNLNSGLVALYNFNGDLMDSSGSNFNLSAGGTFNFVPDRFGNASSAVQLATPAANGTFFLGIGPSLANSSSTVSFWVRKDYVGNSSNGGWVFGLGHPAGTGGELNEDMLVALDYGNYIRYSFFYNDFDSATQIQVSTWHHFAFTFDTENNQRAIYIDGVLDSFQAFSGEFIGGNNLKIGFPGITLDQFRFYNRALSSAEVKALAFSGNPNLTIETALSLKFDTALDRRYTIQTSIDLENWTDVETNVLGDGSRMQRFYEIVSLKQFYRIKP